MDKKTLEELSKLGISGTKAGEILKNSLKFGMDKELFLETINALKKQYYSDLKYAKNASILFPNAHEANLLPDDCKSSEQLLKLLKISFEDNNKDSWIEYFCYELKFGEKYYPGCVKSVNGENIDISSAEKLYEFLIENKTK